MVFLNLDKRRLRSPFLIMKKYKSESCFTCAALGGQISKDDEFDSNQVTDHLYSMNLLVLNDKSESKPKAPTKRPKKTNPEKSKTYETKVLGDKPKEK